MCPLRLAAARKQCLDQLGASLPVPTPSNPVNDAPDTVAQSQLLVGGSVLNLRIDGPIRRLTRIVLHHRPDRTIIQSMGFFRKGEIQTQTNRRRGVHGQVPWFDLEIRFQ
jgi:hypothetical protein